MDSKIWYIPPKNDRSEKNVGIYCRVSTNEKEQLYSLAAQISALTRAVANVGQWRLADTFIDIASAKGEIPRREFERLLKECEAHHISIILTKSISRFGRDTVETLSSLKRLKASGVRVIFEGENLDTDAMDSELMISVMESFAQAENKSRSDNIRLGLAHRAANGTSGLYNRKLYGYIKNDVGELEIDKEQSKVVSNIFRWYIEGASVLVIIKKLADAEIKSPMGKGKWNKRAIETMLANEKYTGTVTLLDSSTQELAYQMKECLPPIITEVEFRAVQEERARRSNVVVDEKGIFQRKSKKYSSKKVTS